MLWFLAFCFLLVPCTLETQICLCHAQIIIFLAWLRITLWFNKNKLIKVGSPDVTWVRMLHFLGRVSNNPAQRKAKSGQKISIQLAKTHTIGCFCCRIFNRINVQGSWRYHYCKFWVMCAQVEDFCVRRGPPSVPLMPILHNTGFFSSSKILVRRGPST